MRRRSENGARCQQQASDDSRKSLNGLVDVVLIHVQVGHQTQTVQPRAQDACIAQSLDGSVGLARLKVHKDQIGLRHLDADTRKSLQALGQSRERS